MIHVLIERHIVDGMLSTYEESTRSALQTTYIVPGFISGETFFDANDAHHRFVLCKWNTVNDWNNWVTSEKRKKVLDMIRPTLKQGEKVTVLNNSYIHQST